MYWKIILLDSSETMQAQLAWGGKEIYYSYTQVVNSEMDFQQWNELYKYYPYKGGDQPYYLTGHYTKYVDPVLGTERVKLNSVSGGANTTPTIPLIIYPHIVPQMLLGPILGELATGLGLESALQFSY